MGKRAKEHRKKVVNRNNRIKGQKKKIEAYFREKIALDNLNATIKKEKESGAFENAQPFMTSGVPNDVVTDIVNS